jgi:hypothetical protein
MWSVTLTYNDDRTNRSAIFRWPRDTTKPRSRSDDEYFVSAAVSKLDAKASGRSTSLTRCDKRAPSAVADASQTTIVSAVESKWARIGGLAIFCFIILTLA